MHAVIARNIRDYVSREWASARRAKDLYWRDRIERLGPAEGLRIAEQLRLQAIAQHPAWPSPAERHEDLRAHVRLAECFRRASAARRA